MKKNAKLGLMTGLLITPAIVAQAGEASASETPILTVASLNAEEIVNQFKSVNEASSKEEIALARSHFANLSEEDNNKLSAEQKALIDAKITYLESFAQLSAEAGNVKTAITKLTDTNKNLVSETKIATAAYEKLGADFDAASEKLSAAAGQNAGDFLETLVFYGGAAENYLQTALTEAVEANLEKYEKITEDIETFIAGAIKPVQEAAQTAPVNKDDYKAAVEQAREQLDSDTLETALKNILKIQLLEANITVEQFIKNAENDFTKAQSVEAKIADIQQNPPTAANFSSKITAIVNEYSKLTELQQALVENYDELEDFNKMLLIMNDITKLTKLAPNTEEFRNELAQVEQRYNLLDLEDKALVTNGVKLSEMRLATASALDVEAKISAISALNADTAVAEARAAYKGLSSAGRRYVQADSVTLLTEWEKSSSTAANVIKQIDAIKTDVFANLETLSDSKKLSTVTGFVTKVRTAESSYSKIKAKDGEQETNAQKLITNRARLEALMPLADIADKVAKLKVTSATYTADLEAARTAFAGWAEPALIPAEEQAHMAKLHSYLDAYLKGNEDEQQKAAELDEAILALQTAAPVDLQKIDEARATYNSLSANGKRLVKNNKVLTDLERQYKSALKVIQTIDKISADAKDFAKKTTAAEKTYDKLAQPMQEVVYNYAKLAELLPIANLMIEIDAIRSSAKDFKEKLSSAQQSLDTLLAGFTVPADLDAKNAVEYSKAQLKLVYEPKLAGHQNTVQSAAAMEARIEALRTKTGETFIVELAEVSAAYKAMNSTVKRNVGNAKLLTELERDYKASLRVIELINKLPANTERSFTSKVTAAQKAYDRLTDKQKTDVFNYESGLKNVLKVADLIGRIDKIRVGSKTYEADVAAIRTEFSLLSPAEQNLVHNITKLTAAETGVADAAGVISLINEAVPTAESYIQKLIDARTAYDNLSRDNQRLVTNYKDLQTRERAVKPVLKLDTDILALDPSNARTFISKYKAAEKAYEKLSMTERALLVNTDKFSGDFKTLYQVIDAINSIKSSSKTFVEETQAARALYTALPTNLAAQVSNLSTLLDHELNVEGGARVDAMIRALNSAPANEFIAKIKEARAAYKALSSANKKAVTLEAELKEQEKYIKPIEAAITAIDGLSNPRNDLSRQFTKVNTALQKLDNKQKEYVTNMDQYSNLSNVIYVYTLIEGLKPNDKYYQGNMEAAKLAYDKLSELEKLKVTNYYKLQQAVLDMTEVQQVSVLIASLNASSSTFEADVEKAAAAYKALPSATKRQVLNYSELQQAERDVKAAQKVIKQIDDLDATLRTYASKAKSAKTAYDRLTVDQKALVKNYNKLQAAIFELGL